ncbi:hypothetical protein [Streptomyces sp. OR43]|uniref:hypothetical protein n=1 Tax=Streptomyces sp. or43 TaxID=2478957 RepID=UPI0011CE2F62|nr:hypothetical protein [Streptomyces sp. or43]TXS36606.1 hypothetical protein EAO72_24460 [Streptomyces sp. or43]
MKSMRHVAASGSLLVLALAAAGCANGEAASDKAAETSDVVAYEADYPVYDSLDQVVKKADVIVQGTVVGSTVKELMPETSTDTDPLANPQAGLSPEEAADTDPVVITVSRVKVSEVLSGDVKPGDIVEVSQLGGERGKVTYKEKHTTALAANGTQYVLMLAAHGPTAPYDLLNPEQALYTAGGTGKIEAIGDAGFKNVGTVKNLKERATRIK